MKVLISYVCMSAAVGLFLPVLVPPAGPTADKARGTLGISLKAAQVQEVAGPKSAAAQAGLDPAGSRPASGPGQSGPSHPAPSGSRVGSAPPPQAGWSLSTLGIRLAGSAVPVKIHADQFGHCYAIAPLNWVIWGQRREADALDIGAPGTPEASWASWGVRGVAGWMIRNDPGAATPESAIHQFLSGHMLLHKMHITYGPPMRDEWGYTWLPYEKDDVAPPRKGVVIYRAFPVAGDPLGYIYVDRFAETTKALWESRGAQAIAVALSIRCTTQLRPSPDAPGRPRADDDKLESTYNQTLGTEYAHNPDTGELYSMNHATDWKEDGPEGAGYYVRSGNDLRKLVPGLPRR